MGVEMRKMKGSTTLLMLFCAAVGADHTQLLHAECTVLPLGWDQDDAPQLLAAANACGTDGTITLPAPHVYTIKSRLHMNLVRTHLNVFGTLSFVPDIGYWIDNSHRVEFQNQSTAWIIEGEDYVVDGGGWKQGGINGNGQAWYTYAQGQSNRFGRPISLTLYNSTNATVKNFSIRNPQFWSFYVQDSHDITLKSIYINGTNTDPHGDGENFETNVDGLDSIRVNDLYASDWLFHGGDDCIAPKGNSTNMDFRNFTCIGGGMAFGSIGQYPDAPDYIANISVTNVTVSQLIRPGYGGASVSGGAYFKSWVGVSAGVPPQGGGGGTGLVSNITFNDLTVGNTTQAIYINKCYHKVDSQANFCDTSTLVFEDLAFNDIKGVVNTVNGIALNCSKAAPCHDISFHGVDLTVSKTGQRALVACDNAKDVRGVSCIQG
ncbi:pectin lyase fold/virulence factor [Xylogone sp. PMI_703]|nr:pectin lyase fold/virulence factor [Xylogone sp. PMI_703]